jgi:RNA polymerase sigma factor (sigma-70 family)
VDAVDTLERPVAPVDGGPEALAEAPLIAVPTTAPSVAAPVQPAVPTGAATPAGRQGTEADGIDEDPGPVRERPSLIDDPEAQELASLVDRARAGERAAFVALVERCRPLVTRVARRYLANPADAEDVVQEVWLSLYEHLDRIHSPELVRSWLCRVTANAALRSQTRSSRVVLGPDVGEGPSGENTEDQGLRRAAQDELTVAMGEALGRLRPQDGRLMALLMTEDRPDYRLVSAMVDRPVGSIGPTRQRILERLRRDPAIANLRVSGPVVA